MDITYIIIPLVAAAIGWGTNKIAVWMLFYPKDPINLKLFTWQGVFPKRQRVISESIGEMVSGNLLNHDMIKNHIFTVDNIAEIKCYVSREVETYLSGPFKEEYPFLSILLGAKNKQKIQNTILSKIEEVVEEVELNFEDYLKQHFDVKKIIVDKINQLDSDEVNRLMNKVINKELQFIEWIGAILGFIIGVVQIVLLEIIA